MRRWWGVGEKGGGLVREVGEITGCCPGHRFHMMKSNEVLSVHANGLNQIGHH